MKIQNSRITVGIAGGGQLGTMMILESRGLPMNFNVYSETGNDPAASIATKTYTGEDFHKFVDESDVVTFEFEHINRELLKYAESQGKLRPSFKSVELKMERHMEKLYLREHGYPLGDFEVCNSSSEALETANKYDNFVIKKSEGGYDGKGQFYKNKMNDFPENDSSVFVVEKFVDFQYEASIISIRDHDGRKYSYDPSYTLNKNGILIKNNSPLIDQEIAVQMKDIAFRLMDDLDYIGVMGIEFFVKDGYAMINEYAPRVHNTGHHTLMGSSISQFESHIRAITELPVSEPVTYVPSGIVNVIGTELSPEQVNRILAVGNTRIYMYGKSEVRRKRKMGHVCVASHSNVSLSTSISHVMDIIYGNELHRFI